MARPLPRRARLTLESPVRSPDGGGGHVLAWTQEGQLWGRIEPRGAAEPALADRPTARLTHRIHLAREPGPGRRPRTDQRLTLGARVFAIHGVAESPDGASLTLHVEEGPFS
ncbi:head-tail adaptor protein [Paralimibaculum aggregatum]|uniref:Head-tail adaptor protein n=1 Tax=Paralimibaculum aggregatum TaxID=3036245 RepID=A0ABQ6LLD4_9RHOB|nr:head-tail adaptor protein [Limibaculum sp. NKW23]GMG81231.1 head-tail adaptor protein [Limibaculum sp. NKW23]